jgi:hypothetical protein
MQVWAGRVLRLPTGLSPLFRAACRLGLEGLVSKRRDGGLRWPRHTFTRLRVLPPDGGFWCSRFA